MDSIISLTKNLTVQSNDNVNETIVSKKSKKESLTPAKKKGKKKDDELVITTCTENTLLNELFVEIHIKPENQSSYFQILQQFDNIYPKVTNVCCWWCCHSFTNPPVGLPRKFDLESKIFHVVGCFCSFNCIAAFNQDKSKLVPSCGTDLLTLMYKIVTGKNDFNLHNQRIKPAPSRYILKMFGGDMSIDAFRTSFTSAKTIDICLAPLIPWAMYCEITDKTKHNSSTTRSAGSTGVLEIKKKKTVGTETVKENSQRNAINQMISFAN